MANRNDFASKRRSYVILFDSECLHKLASCGLCLFQHYTLEENNLLAALTFDIDMAVFVSNVVDISI